MKRLDDDKTSFVDFMRSIKFRAHSAEKGSTKVSNHFAHFSPRARSAGPDFAEDPSSVRSGN